jgi:electron transfer flavoprotein beta subunit
MKVLIPIKKVLDYEAKIKPKSDGSAVETQGIKCIINPFDEIAVEESLRLQEANLVTETIVVAIGDEDCTNQLRYAMAMGADRAILVKTSAYVDSSLAAKILAEISKREIPGLIIMGKQAIDSDSGQTPQMLAAILDWPQASFASKLEVSSDSAIVTREVDGGLERLKVSLPAVISTDLRLNQPRYASLPGIMKAKKKPLQEITLEELSISATVSLEVLKVQAPAARKGGRKVQNVEELTSLLKNEAKVI